MMRCGSLVSYMYDSQHLKTSSQTIFVSGKQTCDYLRSVKIILGEQSEYKWKYKRGIMNYILCVSESFA